MNIKPKISCAILIIREEKSRNKNLRSKPVLRNPSQLLEKLSALPTNHFEFQAYLHSVHKASRSRGRERVDQK